MTTDTTDLSTSDTPVTRDAALKKALQLLDESQAALAASPDRRYTYTPSLASPPRSSTSRGLMYRIESFVDLTRTFVLGH